jgi:pyruvate, water dikinase
MIESPLSTGLAGLDRVFKMLLPGDNLVWQVESLDDYVPFVVPYCEAAAARGRKLIYFRFADHEPLVPEGIGATVVHLRTADGFEQFITEIHRAISEAGQGAFFVFDCLSTLAEAWCSDRMLGNFFRLTCPYVYDRQSIAYFPLLRNTHSFHALTPISNTTQIFLDVYRHKGKLYLHPTKVEQRYSATMYMLHVWDGDLFLPVTESSTIAEILTAQPWAGLESVRLRMGRWNRNFLQAEEVWEDVQVGRRSPEEAALLVPILVRMAVSRDERLVRLAEKYLTLADVLGIWRRMIGTGLVGGKSVGMLVARAILRHSDPRWNELLEPHDSFFIGSDVFYSFLVENGCWWLKQKQRDPKSFLEDVEEARRRILMGSFPDYIVSDFSEMLDYFGQSPIIVRSSSLLEDSYGNAFAGKYESVFCANQGPHDRRLHDFMAAVKTIYASSMSEKALRYRAQRGLLDKDEQMSLLVQRVSGTRYGSLFFPHAAGVALSRNPYVWNRCIDPAAGVLRLVFGLGTRAVDRSDDDYTRIVALNAPERRPEGNFDEVRQYSQRKVDVIDLEASQLVSYDFTDVAHRSPRLPLEIFASDDTAGSYDPRTRGEGRPCGVLTFEHLLTETPFVADMREMLHTIQEAYEYPVDVEFTANFSDSQHCRINLVQCRPLQVVAGTAIEDLPPSVRKEDVILEAQGAVIGQSRRGPIDRLVYVVPSTYGLLPIQQRYSVARLIGRLLHPVPVSSEARHVMLIGPGRWGTTTPSLGVPVSFPEIDTVSVLCEIVAMRDDLVPDVSLGTHFFNDLVEMDILYLALFPGRQHNYWSRTFFEESPNRLVDLLPEAKDWSHVVRVIDVPAAAGNGNPRLKLNANAVTQRVVCYLE